MTKDYDLVDAIKELDHLIKQAHTYRTRTPQFKCVTIPLMPGQDMAGLSQDDLKDMAERSNQHPIDEGIMFLESMRGDLMRHYGEENWKASQKLKDTIKDTTSYGNLSDG